MKNIKISYEYDGSDFFGFQRQPGFRTVQGEIEKALKIILKEKINLVSAGRTDRGVHARHQVSNFFTDNKIPVERMKRVLNATLPSDIVILDVEEVAEDFNSRFSAIFRTYEYDLTWEKSPFTSRYCTYYPEPIDEEKFLEILKPLVGVHDFANFRLSDCGSNTTVREIYEVRCYKKENSILRVYIKGNAFLKSQIRIIIGTALGVYSGKLERTYLQKMLENPHIEYLKFVAEPQGLHLSKIGY